MGSVRWAFPCGAWRPCRQEWLLAAQLVQPEEKDRIGQFVFARDAKAALAGRLLIRKLIAEKLCIPWNEIHLQRTSKGKPFLANNEFSIYSNYNFNVSHQGDYAVLAAEPELQVGIDIMKTNLPGSSSIPNFFRIMKRQFTETEWGVIKSMSNEWMQLDMFHRHWETRLDDYHHIAVALGKQEGFGQKHSDVCCMEPNEPQFTLLTFEDLVASGIPVTPEDSAYWDNFCSKQETPVKQNSHSSYECL
ncbi:L-aminoadipate-semialdehyde dehydrogenase-phosphopantetheinyl transferase isoform X3 [Falco rusticolus]|uniref:L-aminoadipate-semialdehyde dehydrogenase-phosphopantetheinyl transferase isoform X3 n=1 Tax=Falco rusticolus TaxID=120794 RepID=UPI0018867925|nr:L-aminoadipate-semialdehyde dehydrogenase-phosphopantetheinyl transferase isoform X3 [Falco rusticolus]XP_055558432.1 L-aminoadipate-semialdehyde dehydrogenase-phosphopantetheinyl transferase isoform X3 [Falco cherrug]